MQKSTHTRRKNSKPRRGAIIALTAALLIVLMGALAVSVDLGFMYTMQTRMDRSVDAAALAGTSVLIDGEFAAQDLVVEYLVRNPVESSNPITTDDQLAALKAQWLADYGEELELTFGYWNPETRRLESADEPSAVRVAVGRADMPLFFGRALGHDHFTVSSSSTATYRPRDIMLVLDLSASMNDDSELKSINSLGRETVENNLEDIYIELGSPQYGNMPFPPGYATVAGVPPIDVKLPQITVMYGINEVRITSSKDISNVVLELEDGSTIRNESFEDGVMEVTMTANQKILRTYVKSGTNAQIFANTNGYGELFDFTDPNTFVGALELTEVAYPYPSGSWTAYVEHVMASDTANANAGYQYKFGHLNLVNYWLERQPAHHQTPDLAQVSAQPLATVKDAVDLFVDYVREVNTRDRIGLAVYNSATGAGSLEVPLNLNLDQAADVARAGQAGHYHTATNVGGGMAVAANELQQNGRDGAFKLVVVLTDGVANYPDNATAYDLAIAEATRAHSLKHIVMTISLGMGADTSLMQQVADISDGIHFNVPGGQTIQQTHFDLVEAFREIARKRPVMLVE